MVNIIKEELSLEETLRKKIEFICDFTNNKPTIINGSIRKIDKTNLTYIEPHRIIINNTTFLAFNYSNEIFIETYLNGLKSNLDIELIPVLKRYFRDDTEPFIDKNKYNLLSKNILASADPETIKKNLEFISNGENDEEVAKKIAISLLLKFDLTKEKIIDYIMKLDKAEVLAIKNNKKRFIKGKGFVDNIENSDILKELNTYETKIEELEKLLK